MTGAETKKNEVLERSSAGYTICYSIVVILLFRRRFRIQRFRLMKEPQLEKLIMVILPTVATGTAFSLAYLFTESLGCLLENNLGRERGEIGRGAKEGRSEAKIVYYYSTITNNFALVASLIAACYDIVVSNNAFAMVFVVACFIRIWVVPFAGSIYTPEHIMKFDFSLNEMVQFLSFAIGSMLSLFMFASSTEVEEGDMIKFFKDKYPLRRLIKLFSFFLLIFSVVCSFLPRKLSKTSFGLKIKSWMSTRRSDELAKFYRHAVVWLLVILVGSVDIPFLYYSIKFNLNDDYFDWRNAKQMNMVCLLAWPMILVFNACFFFARPKGSATRETFLYLTILGHPTALVVGNFLIGNEQGTYHNIYPIPFFVFFLWLALKTRKHLANQGDRVISEHLNGYLLRMLSTMPPLLFLFAEGEANRRAKDGWSEATARAYLTFVCSSLRSLPRSSLCSSQESGAL